jgi:hypothetical protein
MVDAPSIIPIQTTLTWREDALYAGNVYIGRVREVYSWKAHWLHHLASSPLDGHDDWDEEHPTESSAREALEIAAAKALRGEG